jgi:hypothetical protein
MNMNRYNTKPKAGAKGPTKATEHKGEKKGGIPKFEDYVKSRDYTGAYVVLEHQVSGALPSWLSLCAHCWLLRSNSAVPRTPRP